MGDVVDWRNDSLNRDADTRRRRYRRLQSWYRETVLEAPYGWTRPRSDGKGGFSPSRPVGSWLDAEWVAQHPSANFLAPGDLAAEILAYVDRRQSEVIAAGGTLEPARLRRNMLSSMPLCFNLFGPLRARPEAAVELLRECFQLDAVELVDVQGIRRIECEWAPPAAAGLGDRTAFDAVVAYRNGRGETCLLGVETKYTETFSPTTYGRPGDAKEADRRLRYVDFTKRGWFQTGAEDRLWERTTNQLWRNVMLGAVCERLPDVERVDVAVVALHRDPHAMRAVEGVRANLVEPDRLRFVSLERILRFACTVPVLGEWAGAFRRRYTDLTPVAEDDEVSRTQLQQLLDRTFPSGCRVGYDLGDNVYELNCPWPTVHLVDSHLEIDIWHENDWGGRYPIVSVDRYSDSSGNTIIELDGGRFRLTVPDPPYAEAMARARVTAMEQAKARLRQP